MRIFLAVVFTVFSLSAIKAAEVIRHPTFELYGTEVSHQAANFAGQFMVAKVGCGTGCLNLTIVDLAAGNVYEVGWSKLRGGIEYHRDSNLLVVNTFDEQGYDEMANNLIGEQVVTYYRWTGSELEPILKESWHSSTELEATGDVLDYQASQFSEETHQPKKEWKAVAYTASGDTFTKFGLNKEDASRAAFEKCEEIRPGYCIKGYSLKRQEKIFLVSCGEDNVLVSAAFVEGAFYPDRKLRNVDVMKSRADLQCSIVREY